MNTNADFLRGVDLFSALADDQLIALAKRFHKKHYEKDDWILVEEDEPDHSLFIIIKGQVKVFVSGEEGREAILALLSNGDFFGEMSLLDGEPRSASVRAMEPTELLVLRRDEFFAELRRLPELSFTLLAEMSRRLRRANRQISSLALLSVYGRIASTLLQLKDQQGLRTKTADGKPCVVIHNRPSQQQLAEMSGTTRETVSRILSSLQKRGSIAISGKDLYILQEGELKLGDT